MKKNLGMLLLMMVWGGATVGRAQDQQIGFLVIIPTDDGFTLLEASLHPGKIKRPRAAAFDDGFYFEALAPSGEVVWTAPMTDPLDTTKEVAREDGRFEQVDVPEMVTPFVIRFPAASGDTRLIRFFRVKRSPDALGKQTLQKTFVGDLEVRFDG